MGREERFIESGGEEGRKGEDLNNHLTTIHPRGWQDRQMFPSIPSRASHFHCPVTPRHVSPPRLSCLPLPCFSCPLALGNFTENLISQNELQSLRPAGLRLSSARTRRPLDVTPLVNRQSLSHAPPPLNPPFLRRTEQRAKIIVRTVYIEIQKLAMPYNNMDSCDPAI